MRGCWYSVSVMGMELKKPVNHRGTETQREKPENGLKDFPKVFLCVSVPLW
jgi:hypothetical protein